MKKTIFASMGLLFGLIAASTAFARPTIYPTGVTIYDPQKAYNGYTLISEDYRDVAAYVDPKGKGLYNEKNINILRQLTPPPADAIYLIDMNGNRINQWELLTDRQGGKKSRLLTNGNLLAMAVDSKKVIEFDWKGNVVWEYNQKPKPHHDMQRLENGNTLILCVEEVPQSIMKKVKNKERKKLQLEGDTIIEITPEGEVVWELHTSEHLDINQFSSEDSLDDWTHGNTVSIIPENKWYDAGDKRFTPGNIIFNARNINQFFIIDKASRKIVWESPKDFKGLQGFSHQHEPNMIPKGYPGEGNIILFDNGNLAKNTWKNSHSVVWEIRPDTFEVVWRYATASPLQKFHSGTKGSAYKLPNGNVLISEDMGGRVFQVKPDNSNPDGGEIVWEYVSGSGLARTQMYPYDHTAYLKSRGTPKQYKVSPMDPINLKVLPDYLRKSSTNVMSYK